MSKNWYSIQAAVGTKESEESAADVYIFDYIGGWEITAKSFIDELKVLDADRINLHINSPGGYVFDGVAIQNVLKHHKAKVTVWIDGLAASIASVIALAGDEVKIADNAYVMIHNPISLVMGEAKDMLKEAEVLNKITDGIAGDYSRRMGITVDEAKALMEEETWYLGQEAVDAGFADSLYAGTKAAASMKGEGGRQKGEGERRFDMTRVAAKAPAEVLARFSDTDKSSEVANNKEISMGKTREKKLKAVLTPENTDENGQTPTDTDADKAADTTEDTPKNALVTCPECGAEFEAPEAPAEEPEETPVPEEETEDKGQEAEDVAAAVKAAVADERKRTAAITALGGKFGFADAATKAISDGVTVDTFRAQILAKSPDEWKASLAVKNPTVQASAEDDSEAAETVAAIKAKRNAKQ